MIRLNCHEYDMLAARRGCLVHLRSHFTLIIQLLAPVLYDKCIYILLYSHNHLNGIAFFRVSNICPITTER